MEMPKLSLIITSYNKAKFLRRCLDSVNKQLTDEVQAIVIDDCSTDGSDKILLDYPRFDRVILLKNVGVSQARNEGIDYAKANAVAFLDGDDTLIDGAIGTMLAFTGRIDKWPIMQFGQKRIHSNGRIVYSNVLKGSYERAEPPKYWQMVWNKVYDKRFILAHSVRFRSGMRFGEDELFNLDLLEQCPKIWHAPQTLVCHWLDDDNSICRGGTLTNDDCLKLDNAISEKIAMASNERFKDFLLRRRNYLRGSKIFKDCEFSTQGTGKRDIVYMLREGKNEELRYSLRSVEQNFAYRQVWFAGGKPEGLEPDRYMGVEQDMPNKWENVRKILLAVCKNDEISEDFWLFNDDFFILKPCDDSLPQYYNGTLADQIKACEKWWGPYDYTIRLRHLAKTLEDAGLETLNYSVHKPILVNRKKALEVLKKYPNEPMFRALYGNYWKIGGVNCGDNKIRRNDKSIPSNWQFVSSQDDSFAQGIVGRQLRDMFKDKSRFEV